MSCTHWQSCKRMGRRERPGFIVSGRDSITLPQSEQTETKVDPAAIVAEVKKTSAPVGLMPGDACFFRKRHPALETRPLAVIVSIILTIAFIEVLGGGMINEKMRQRKHRERHRGSLCLQKESD